MSEPRACTPIDPSSVECWVFDLDNTLYPARSNLFSKVSQRMTTYIQTHFDLDQASARSLQKRLFREHGTTLRGLMSEYRVSGVDFLDFVHDIDVSDLPADGALDRVLEALPGRKVIYTNGSVPHAERVTRQLGIDRHFEGIFDIVAAGYDPKPNPAPYHVMLKRFAIAPERAVMVEDTAKNLAPAHDLGMTTVWLRHAADWSSEGADGGYVHHTIDDLLLWLLDVVGAR
jgi:putative hydrolase of the HAD superfamily